MTDRTITISLVQGELSLPPNVETTVGDTVTWTFQASPDVRWLVSFVPGAPFTVENANGAPTALPNSLEVRNGQRIRVPPERKGRFEYLVAVATGDGIFGVFDCPSIIIT